MPNNYIKLPDCRMRRVYRSGGKNRRKRRKPIPVPCAQVYHLYGKKRLWASEKAHLYTFKLGAELDALRAKMEKQDGVD